jgi:hypothetical protein
MLMGISLVEIELQFIVFLVHVAQCSNLKQKCFFRSQNSEFNFFSKVPPLKMNICTIHLSLY